MAKIVFRNDPSPIQSISIEANLEYHYVRDKCESLPSRVTSRSVSELPETAHKPNDHDREVVPATSITIASVLCLTTKKQWFER
jgi:hypothetical protein